MKNYELIAELLKLPAGKEIRFCGVVEEKDIITQDEIHIVSKEIKDYDEDEKYISLCG